MTLSPFLTLSSSFFTHTLVYARQNLGWTLSIAGHISLLLLALFLFSSPQPYSAHEGAISVDVVTHMSSSPNQKTAPLDKPASVTRSELPQPPPTPNLRSDPTPLTSVPPPSVKEEAEEALPEKPKPTPIPKSDPTPLTSVPPPSVKEEAEDALPELMKKLKTEETKTIADVLNETKMVDPSPKVRPALKPEAPPKRPPLVEQEKKQEKTDPVFDTKAIENLLLDKKRVEPPPKAMRHTETSAATRGIPGGSSARLSLGQRDALGTLFKEQLAKCWSIPVGLNTEGYKPEIVIHLDENGGVVGTPEVVNKSLDPSSRALADSAVRAVLRCAPFHIPRSFSPFYSEWRDWHITFDPQDFMG